MSTRLEQRRIALTADTTIKYPFHVPGTLFTNRGASGSVTATLPTPSAALIGCWYEFRVFADQSFIVAAPSVNTLVTLDDSAADNVGYQISGKKVGRGLRVICDGTSWFAFPYGALDGFCVDGTEYPFEIGSVKTDAITGTDSSLGITGQAAAQGGDVVVTGGTSSTAGNAGGVAQVTGGTPGSTGVGGAATVAAGAGGSASGNGGVASLTGGAGTAGNGAGGIGKTVGGAGQGTGAGGAAQLTGGASGAGATGNGGNAAVTGGAAASTNGSGGSTVLTPGAKTGTGIAGGNFRRSATAMHFEQRAAAVAKTDAAETLTAAEMINGIVVHTVSTGRTLTTPTGAAISAGCPAELAVGDCFYLHVITVGTGADDISTLTAGDGNVTFVGRVTVGPDSANNNGYGTFLFRNTGANTWVGYRIG